MNSHTMPIWVLSWSGDVVGAGLPGVPRHCWDGYSASPMTRVESQKRETVATARKKAVASSGRASTEMEVGETPNLTTYFTTPAAKIDYDLYLYKNRENYKWGNNKFRWEIP